MWMRRPPTVSNRKKTAKVKTRNRTPYLAERSLW
jgi:hypothetical protein